MASARRTRPGAQSGSRLPDSPSRVEMQQAELSFSAAEGADLGSSENRSGTQKLLPHPGEDAYLHHATQWRESTDRILASMSLLHPAKGGETLRATELVDFPVDRLPVPVLGDANYA